ncbi:molybdate ABC transporter permease subunit [Roseibium marinum]|uniref:Molybdenum transport system permease n=1 Tax=Roseibium marinum TaxID=281252 RepID=A0A2S3V1N7_9HYPH|nr:molybdate ABC transporter permease subunit [Roseibium marinum]POF33882.1 molybdate transport system permease protein [Roseibium marinum]
MTFDWSPVLLSLKLATITTLVLLIVGTPIAWRLARLRHWIKQPLVSLVALPLVLPPTVLGFYLLLVLAPNGFVGQIVKGMGLGTIPFTFPGLVIASVFYSLPFAVQPLQNAFEGLGERPLEVASTLRATPLDRFFTVVVPLARPGFLTAAVLSFAHTIGEFGVVLMIGGNIPGQTKVLSVAIYDHVETLEYDQAHVMSAGMLVFAFTVLLVLYAVNGRIAVAEKS